MLTQPLFVFPSRCPFLCPKNGVTQTDGAGVTQTDLCGVSHTAKVVQKGL